MSALAGRTIALAVTGSIAAYKAVEVARLCIKAGAKVLPLLTTSGARFVGATTLSGITGESVATDMWDPAYPGEMHVAIAARADVLAIVPATADLLARLAQGRADDLVTATAMCMRGPVLAAPAMHPNMWTHPATQANVARLSEQGRVTLVGPVSGVVASGDVGMGRMTEPAQIVEAIIAAITNGGAIARDLDGRHVVVTAGPTHEPLDPVRFLGNRSSGKMGFAIAAAAAARGARVTLIAGPVSLATPSSPSITRVDVESATEMQTALDAALGADLANADVLVMAAAVADYRPAAASATKLKKDGDAVPAVTLVKNPDLLATIGARRASQSAAKRMVLVGFALETGDDATVLAYAKKKLDAKQVDLIVANAAHESLGKTTNRIALLTHDNATSFTESPKATVATRILDATVALLGP